MDSGWSHLSSMDHMERADERSWVETAAVTSPALVGLAAGILLGDAMRKGARKPTALILASLGLAAAAPLLSGTIVNKVKGPTTARGRRRTLQGIREGGIHADEIAEYEEDEDFQLGVG